MGSPIVAGPLNRWQLWPRIQSATGCSFGHCSSRTGYDRRFCQPYARAELRRDRSGARSCRPAYGGVKIRHALQ